MSRPVYLRVFLTVVAIAVAISHARWPDVKIDGVTLGLVVLAALPWLAPIIKSIEMDYTANLLLRTLPAIAQEINPAGDQPRSMPPILHSGSSLSLSRGGARPPAVHAYNGRRYG